MRFFPALKTATTRRDFRRQVRNALGTSSDPAPESQQVFRALTAMQPLVVEATNGSFHLVLMTNRDEAVSPYEAMAANRQERIVKPAGAVAFSADEIAQLRQAIPWKHAINPSIAKKLGL